MAKKSSNPETVTQRKRDDTANRNSTGLFFPSNLFDDDNGNAICFHIYEYEKPSPTKKELRNPKVTISLPIPNELSQNNGIQYNSFDGGFMERSLAITGTDPVKTYDSVASAFTNPVQTTKNIAKSLSNGISDPTAGLGSAASTALSLGGNALGTFASRILGDEFSVLSSYAKKTLNPYTQAVFQSVNLREYQFQYMMIARNQKESENIYKICETLKKSAFPTKQNDYQLGFPDILSFTFLPKKVNKWLFTPNICAISSINISYNGQTGIVFFEDTGAPVVVTMTLQLIELTFDTAETLDLKNEEKQKQKAKENTGN